MKLKKQTSWYHICATWDSVEGTYCLYRDADISTSVSGKFSKFSFNYRRVLAWGPSDY